MRLTHKGAAALVVGAALIGGAAWLSFPEPIENCLEPVIEKDQAAAQDQRQLVALGEAAELKGQKTVEFARDQFFSCTRHKAFSAEWPPQDIARAAYDKLAASPSFEYGRHRVMAKREAPGLNEDELVVTARMMRAALSLAEARKQLTACDKLAAQDTQALVDIAELSEPYLTAVIWNMGLATSPEEAKKNAAQLGAMTLETAEVPACTSSRLSTELKALRQFKTGDLPGLPCHVEYVEGEPLLNCNR